MVPLLHDMVGAAKVSSHAPATKSFLLPVLQVRSLGWQPTLGWGEDSREKAPSSNGQIDEGRQHLIGSNLGGGSYREVRLD